MTRFSITLRPTPRATSCRAATTPYCISASSRITEVASSLTATRCPRPEGTTRCTADCSISSPPTETPFPLSGGRKRFTRRLEGVGELGDVGELRDIGELGDVGELGAFDDVGSERGMGRQWRMRANVGRADRYVFRADMRRRSRDGRPGHAAEADGSPPGTTGVSCGW